MDVERDPLVRWAAQAVPGRGRRYATAGAVAVTARDLNRRDRLVLVGEPEAAQRALELALVDSPEHVILGEQALVRGLRGVTPVATFGWMQLDGGAPRPDPGPRRAATVVRWVDDAEATAVLDRASPGSWVRPGEPAVHAWAGAEVGGRVVAVGALAHCAVDVAFLAGVATLPEHRGHGLSTAVCGFLRDEGLRGWGTVALMVDADNAAAIAVYTRLGFTYRAVTAARPELVR